MYIIISYMPVLLVLLPLSAFVRINILVYSRLSILIPW